LNFFGCVPDDTQRQRAVLRGGPAGFGRTFFWLPSGIKREKLYI
jgi:hypothetical protein